MGIYVVIELVIKLYKPVFQIEKIEVDEIIRYCMPNNFKDGWHEPGWYNEPIPRH